MGYDKIVDSAQLDGAIRATADSIREKTGDTNPIQWDLDKGFSETVEAISTGGADERVKEILEGTITELSDNTIETLRENIFRGSRVIRSINLPNLKTIGGFAFSWCTSLELSELPPLVEEIGRYAFENCTSITINKIPAKVSTLGGYNFQSCSKINRLLFENPDFSYISSDAFSRCAKLSIIIFRNISQVVTISSANVFKYTPFNSTAYGVTGKALVPRTLIETYQNATNWSTLYAAGTCTFLPLEEYTVDGTTTGEIDWDKVNALEQEG